MSLKIQYTFVLGILLMFSCQRENRETSGEYSSQEIKYFSPGNLKLQALPEKAVDTFVYWKQLGRYFQFDHKISEEELQDKLELVYNALNKIKQTPFPPKLNQASVKSRLLLLENETLQLQWVLKHQYEKPSPDSLFIRWLYAYDNLYNHVNLLTRKEQNFEEIFKAKKIRDSLLKSKFEQNKDGN